MTSGHYTRQYTHMTCKPNMTPKRFRQLREWHVRLAKELAQEQQRYFQNPQPYKTLKHADRVLRETGHRGIKAVRLQDGTVTNDPEVVLEEVLNSFLRQHNTEDGELSAYTEETDIVLAETLQPNTATRHAPSPVHHSGTR